MAVVGGEAAVANIMLDQGLLLMPAVAQPALKSVMVFERDARHGEPTPVHIDGLRGPALDVGVTEGEDVLTVGAAGDALVRNGAVVEPVDGAVQLLQAVLEACAAGQEEVGEVAQVALGGPLRAAFAGVAGEVGTFGEDDEPHGVESEGGAAEDAAVGGFELLEAVAEARLVFDPVAGHEDEAVEHHAGADDGDILEGFFEDDVDVTVHVVCVCYPPQVEPVRVQLVVRDHDQPLGKSGLQAAVFGT